MPTYYDALNDFHKLNETNPLQSSAQLVYLHLLHLNNRLKNCGTVQVSDRELGLRTQLISKQSITDAKRTLKNRGLIYFKTDKSKPGKATVYSITFFTGGQTAGQTPGQSVGQTTGQASSSNPDLSTRRAPAKSKTEEVKIERNFYNEVSGSKSDSDAMQEQFGWLVKEWEAYGGAKPNDYLAGQLAELERTHTRDNLKLALKKAADNSNSKFGFSLKFYLKNLEFVEEDAKENDPDYRERVSEYKYESSYESETPPPKETKVEKESDSWLVRNWELYGGEKLNSNQTWKLECFTKNYDPEFPKFLLQKMGESLGNFDVELFLKNLENPEYTEPFVEIKRRKIQEQFNNPVNENDEGKEFLKGLEELRQKFGKPQRRKRNY